MPKAIQNPPHHLQCPSRAKVKVQASLQKTVQNPHSTCIKVQVCKSHKSYSVQSASTTDARGNSKSTTPPAVSFKDKSQSASIAAKINSKSTQHLHKIHTAPAGTKVQVCKSHKSNSEQSASITAKKQFKIHTAPTGTKVQFANRSCNKATHEMEECCSM